MVFAGWFVSTNVERNLPNKCHRANLSNTNLGAEIRFANSSAELVGNVEWKFRGGAALGLN
jgi:hypothetical protein